MPDTPDDANSGTSPAPTPSSAPATASDEGDAGGGPTDDIGARLTALLAWLRRRTVQLEAAVRTGKIGAAELTTPRGTGLLDRIDTEGAAPIFGRLDGIIADSAAEAQERNALLGGMPFADFIKHNGIRATRETPRSRAADSATPPRADAEPPRDSAGNRIQWTLSTFLGQQFLSYFWIYDSQVPGEDWRDWVFTELESLVDAVVLELLIGREGTGYARIEGFRASLGHARYYHWHGTAEPGRDGEERWIRGAKSGPWQGRFRLFDEIAEELPASRAMRDRLVGSPGEATHALWRLLANPSSIVETVKGLVGNSAPRVWLEHLLPELAAPYHQIVAKVVPEWNTKPANTRSHHVLALAETLPETERERFRSALKRFVGGLRDVAWLLDPGTLKSVMDAADVATRIGDAPEGDDARRPTPEWESHADALEHVRRRLIQRATPHDTPAPRALARTSKRRPPNESVRDERLLTETWLNSFSNPAHIAAFTEGAGRGPTSRAEMQDLLIDAEVKKPGHRPPETNSPGQTTLAADFPSPRAVVYGAGIAGLTAAHELASRGFSVMVIERRSEESTPAHARAAGKSPLSPQVGGVARTQWSRPWPFDASQPRPTTTVPGEHGFRHFPSFYRHVFDTMRRTPLGDTMRPPAGDTIQRTPQGPDKCWPGFYPTAFDQLAPTRKQIFARRSELVPLRRDSPRTLESFRKEYMALHKGLRFPKRDMARFFFKLLRYLMTSSERRAAEYGQTSLLDFFDPSLYSAEFIEMIKATPQALVAMDAEHCDARTQGNVFLQLLLDQVVGSDFPDGTLRGPSGPSWFDHWYAYLHRTLDVQFVCGQLLSIAPADADGSGDNSAPRVLVQLASSEDRGRVQWWLENADYHVVATDVVAAERVTRHWRSLGVPADLRGFTTQVQHPLTARLDRFDVPVHRLTMRDGAAVPRSDA